MFGYVTAYKPELKMKDFAKYKAYYCGLCHELKHDYGFLGQMTLTYDMTFAIVLLTSLYESDTKKTEKRCVVHPIRKQNILQNEITEYGSAMNVILAYYHMQDDWKDEKSIGGLTGATLLKKNAAQIEHKYPRQCKIIQEQLKNLEELERKNCDDIDAVAGCFGQLMSELFVYKQDLWEPCLRRLGFFLGKFIYIMDAVDDIEKDIREENYNPLKKLYQQMENHKEDFYDKCKKILTMMIAECSEEFEKLPCVQDIDILRNILYDGVWVKYNQKLEKLNEENERK